MRSLMWLAYVSLVAGTVSLFCQVVAWVGLTTFERSNLATFENSEVVGSDADAW